MNKIDKIKNDIIKASDYIDQMLETINEDNRGEIARSIIKNVRDLNDGIANLIYRELNPNEDIEYSKVGRKFEHINPYYFIGKFHKYLNKSISHFTPNPDGAERLMIKYYQYILQLQKVAKEKYGIEIVRNLDKFLLDTDIQTKDYYEKVSVEIKKYSNFNLTFGDNYYIRDIKPFFVNKETYFEVVLEPALNKSNKYNRVVAFTKYDIRSEYCVSLNIATSEINVFDVEFPINLIIGWDVSIRPCEFKNFGKMLLLDIDVQRNHGEYKAMMKLLRDSNYNLVDIIDLPQKDYDFVKQEIIGNTKSKKSQIIDILDKCKEISDNNKVGKNIIRYTLYSLNNDFIKEQIPKSSDKSLSGYNILRKSYAFDKQPYAFNPAGKLSSYNMLFNAIDPKGHEHERLYRTVLNYSSNENCIFIPIKEMNMFGDESEIRKLASKFNKGLVDKHKECSLEFYKNMIYISENRYNISAIFNLISHLENSNFLYRDAFSEELISQLSDLDSSEKRGILFNLFDNSRVKLIYGAAGTGKTRLLYHVASLLPNCRKLFIAKTNAAVNNLQQKVNVDSNCFFMTVDKFKYDHDNYDLIVVDECSTVKNEEILNILEKVKNAGVILVGDIYQIEAIGLGNWFYIAKDYFKGNVISELTDIHRSDDEGLVELWKYIRNYSVDNYIIENLVANDFSHIIDKDIFVPRAKDEIVLCLNYNGLYGLNNINRLMQLSNPNPSYKIGIWEFKVDDPILFNDSNRFEVLHNNLKGRIRKIVDNGDSVLFELEVDKPISRKDCLLNNGLSLLHSDEKNSLVSFTVQRTKAYESDNDGTNDEHVLPFQVAYAVSIHKSQGLEYESVKIVIADESEEQITHSIFYTAITRARKHLTLYWTPEVCNRVINNIKPKKEKVDFSLLKAYEKEKLSELPY